MADTNHRHPYRWLVPGEVLERVDAARGVTSRPDALRSYVNLGLTAAEEENAANKREASLADVPDVAPFAPLAGKMGEVSEATWDRGMHLTQAQAANLVARA